MITPYHVNTFISVKQPWSERTCPIFFGEGKLSVIKTRSKKTKVIIYLTAVVMFWGFSWVRFGKITPNNE